MEEILASIRRILNEDPSTQAPEAAPADDGVLVLDQSMRVTHADSVEEPFAEPAEEAEPVSEAPAPVMAVEDVEAAMAAIPAPRARGAGPDLVAPEAAAQAAMAMGNLMRTLAADRRPSVWAQGPTLEDIVRITLRPLLKEWLDQHLPPMVERLVRVEIERVVGRVIP
jgi:cell pole-organizing protein PopZ